MKLRARAGSQETLPAATEATTTAPGKSSGVSSQLAKNLSSLDALDLPTEIEGVFVLATKRHKKHNCLCGKRVKTMRRVVVSILITLIVVGAAASTNSRRCNQWLHKRSAGRECAGRDGQALRSRAQLQSRYGDGFERRVQLQNLAAGEYLVEAEASGFALAPAQSVDVERGKTTTHRRHPTSSQVCAVPL